MFDQHISKDKAKRGRCSLGRRQCYMCSVKKYRKPQYIPPFEDVGYDAVDLGLIDDLLDEHLRTLISPDIWARYTTPVPFCTVPEGGTDPKKQGGRTMPRNYFRKPTEVKAEKALLASFSREATAKLSDELPPLPTFAEQLAKAGGKVLSVPNVNEVADWHEQDGSI